MERRLIDANDQVLWRMSVVIDGHRYVPWEAIAKVPTAEVPCPNCGARMDGGANDAKE